MAKRLYSVPFHTHTTDVFEVEASSPAEAAMHATLARQSGSEPTHSHVTKFSIGTVKATIVDDDGPTPAA